MLYALVQLQASIHAAVSAQLDSFAAGGDWLALVAMLPVGIVFGALHALTPGHNKLTLATYVVGDGMGALKSGTTALLLSAVHIGSAVIIGLWAGFLVSRSLTSAGRAPVLEMASQGLMLGMGLWLVARGVLGRKHVHGERYGFALMAGLVPCPLTLFIMVLAQSRGIPEAGLAFAAAMLVGVGGVLMSVALAASVLRSGLQTVLRRFSKWTTTVNRYFETAAGALLIIMASMGLAAA